MEREEDEELCTAPGGREQSCLGRPVAVTGMKPLLFVLFVGMAARGLIVLASFFSAYRERAEVSDLLMDCSAGCQAKVMFTPFTTSERAS